MSSVRNLHRKVIAATAIMGLIAALGFGGYLLIHHFRPQSFDREVVNAAELAALQSAPLSTSANTSTDWPQFLGPNRDGRAPNGPLALDWEKTPPRKLWSVPGGGGYSALTVVGGQVHATDKLADTERVICRDAATGATVWSQAWPADDGGIGYSAGPRAAPTVHEGIVYALGAAGKLRCVRPAGSTAEVVWERDLKAEFRAATPTWGFASAPLIDGQLVIVQPGGKGGAVVALDRTTGTTVWTAGSEPTGYSSPVVATLAGVRQIVAVTGERLLGIAPKDGSILWAADWRTQHYGNIAVPVVVGDYVFVSSNYNKGCALFHIIADGNSQKVEQVYFRKSRTMQNHHSSCVHADGFVYGFDGDTLRCVDLRAGEVVDEWVAKDAGGKRIEKGSLILAGKHLLGLTQTGTLFLADADPTEFKFRGKVEAVLTGNSCWAHPVLVDGRVYLRDAETVVCYDVRP